MKVRISLFFFTLLFLAVGCISSYSTMVRECSLDVVNIELILTKTPLIEKINNGVKVVFTFQCRSVKDVFFPEEDYYEVIYLYEKGSDFILEHEPGTVESLTNRNSWRFVSAFNRKEAPRADDTFTFTIDVPSSKKIAGLIVGIPIISFEKIKKLDGLEKCRNGENIVYFEVIKDGQFLTKLTPLKRESCHKEDGYYEMFQCLF